MFNRVLTDLANITPRGIVYKANVALKKPINGKSVMATSEGILKPIGGGKGRTIQLITVITITLIIVPRKVDEIIKNFPLSILIKLPDNFSET